MNEQKIILDRLLNKYEGSKHLLEPGASSRRVMLSVKKKGNEFPEYDYEDATTRDAYNEAALELEKRNLVELTWVKGRPLLSCIALRLDRIAEAYSAAGREHPRARADRVISCVTGSLEGVTVPWIADWKTEVCRQATQRLKVPPYCEKDETPLRDLVCAFRVYSELSGPVTMRAFSSKCFSDTKYFERNVRDRFLKIARMYDADFAQSCEENGLKERDQLALLGIYARPEIYELAGDCRIQTDRGIIFLDAFAYGLGVPSTQVDLITEIDLTEIECITFIENKTNYDEYVQSEKQPQELVVYHGGFNSPQKRKLFTMLSRVVNPNTEVRFWADIDMGGFRMFHKLQEIFPTLEPMRMSGEDVEKFYQYGLARPALYLEKLRAGWQAGEYPLFGDAIEKILYYGVTVEQESFLT